MFVHQQHRVNAETQYLHNGKKWHLLETSRLRKFVDLHSIECESSTILFHSPVSHRHIQFLLERRPTLTSWRWRGPGTAAQAKRTERPDSGVTVVAKEQCLGVRVTSLVLGPWSWRKKLHSSVGRWWESTAGNTCTEKHSTMYHKVMALFL